VVDAIRWIACLVLVCCIVPGHAASRDMIFETPSQPAQTDVQQASTNLTFVRAFSSADDVKRSHPILDRSLDIIAGSKDETREDVLRLPSALTTDSNHRVFVADPAAKTVHVFDFLHSKYSLVEKDMGAPVSLASDGSNNLYVVERSSRTVLIYDSAGKFRGYLGKLRGGESYFDTPTSIAIDKTTGRIYVCDRYRHMIIIMDNRGRLLGKIGKRGGGDRQGEFRLPIQVAVGGGEVFVLDERNTRVQIFDASGSFRRAINLAYVEPRSGLTVDDQGRIYVSDPALNQIQVFRPEGQPFYTMDLSTIKGANFGHPSAILVDAGYCLYVVDSESNHVGLFQISGQNARHCQ
jgi:DNA-binding beta-propeller fold protein YncE